MREQEQGVLIECIYCQVLNKIPEKNSNSKKCPRCHGQTKYFKPARMMDRSTSNQAFLHKLTEVFIQIQEINPDIFFQDFTELSSDDLEKTLSLLESLVLEMHIYTIDFKEALIQLYQQISKMNAV